MSGDSGETNLIVPETETVSENNVTQPGKKEKRNYCYVCKIQCAGDRNFKDHLAGRKHKKNLGIPLPVPQQNKREKTSNMKSTSKNASTPKKSSSKKPSTSDKVSSSSEHRDMSFKEKHHDSHIQVIGSLNERMNNSSNRYNKNNKYSDSHYQNRYATHTNDKYYSHNYRTGKQYYNNRSYNWNSYSNSPQRYNFNYRPRNYYYSHDKYNLSRENEFPLENDNTYYNHYNNNYGESSHSVNCEENLEHVNMDDNEKHETSYRNLFLSNLPSSENPFRKLYSENDVSSPKSSKDRLTAEASVSDGDERAVSNTNKLTDLSKSNTSAPRKCFSISKIGSKRTITRSRSLSASESDKKRKDKTDQAESEESEEQRIQDWTNSLLENNHNQITRLVNPSNNKEKAAVNHLITQFSKSKRKEILTRTLRTNSSELTDNDDRDLIYEGEPVNTEDEEISVVLDSKIINSNLEQSDINLSSLSASKTINSENSENNRINQDKECETVLEPSKSPYQSSKMYKKYEKLKDNNFASNQSSYNNNSNISYREKYVKRKSGGSDAKVKKKQKTDSIRSTTCVNRNESEDLNTDNPRQTMISEFFCSPISAKTPNQDLSASDIKEEVIETTGENVADSSSTTNNEKTLEENLVFSPDVSVDTLIQLFASGSVKVKEEFNDPVMDVLKEINPDELINACSNNSIHSCEETVNKSNTNSANCINSKETSFLEACMGTVHKNKSGMNPVILGSAAIEQNTSPGSVPAKSCALNESPCSSVATEPTPSTSERSELRNHSFSCTDNDKNSDNSSLNFNEINNTKVGLPPYLNKLIKQLQDITSEEEKVKENLIEAKSKINMYASLLEEWKTKKKVLNEEEESLRKQRNNIIKLMQNAVKTDSDHDEQESKSSSLEDDRLGDLSTNKKKQVEENSAEIVNASKTSHNSLSSLAEKQQKQVKTGLSPGSPESDEIVIISPPKKPKPPEIVICDDEENISLGNQTKVSRQEVNSNIPPNKSSSLYDLRTVDAHTTVINSLVVFEDFLYTCSNDNTAKRYSLKSATPSVTYQHTAKNVTEIVVEKVQNEALVFTSCSARLISLFIAASGTKIKNFFPPCPVMSICKGWGKFYAGLANGSVNVYNWKYEEIELVKTEHPASRIATAHQGRLHVLVILSSEGNIAIRDAETGLLIRYIKINIKHPSWMCLHNDLAYLSSADKILIVLDIMSGKIEKKLHMNSHTTGLAVYDDFIFTISYNGIINCYNKDKSNDKRLFYGTGKAGLTCIHVYNNWVFTGNRKGDVSLFHFDPSSFVACEFGKCDVVYGLKEDLEYHIEKDHLQKKKLLTQCNWRGCNFKFPRGADIVDKMNHVKTHFYQMDFAPTFLVSC